MKHIARLLCTSAFVASAAVSAQAGVIGVSITGVLDGPLSGGVPKLVELFAHEDIADLSSYSLSNFNNGNTSANATLTFSGSVSAGDFFYAVSATTDDSELTSFFGSLPSMVFRGGNAVSINGNDAFRVTKGATVVDSFGDVGVDGTGEPWDYRDGWAYRNDATGPDGDTFQLVNWSFSGRNALDGFGSNAAAGSAAFPIGTYSDAVAVVPLPASGLLLVGAFGALAVRRRIAKKAA